MSPVERSPLPQRGTSQPGNPPPPHRPPAAALRGQHLTLTFGRRVIIDQVSLALRPGRVTALVGPNGSGKSTLLRALAGLHPSAAGSVFLRPAGQEQEQPARSLRPRMFAQEVTLFTQSRVAPQGISVREVVSFGRHPYRRRFDGLSGADRAAVDQALEATGITAMAEQAAGELSGGELQRVWLAACLAQDTGVVLLDEPTNHLDLRYQIDTLDLIRDLADERGVAVGVVLHDLDHAARVADEILLLHQGAIIARGSPTEVLTASNIRQAYDIDVDVSFDPCSGRLRIDPRSRRERGEGPPSRNPLRH